MGWTSFLRTFLAVFGAAIGLVYAFIVVMNPYGNLPVHVFGSHVIMDSNQRFQFPAIVRAGGYDSALFGTSTSRLLDPTDLEQAFGGRFANLSMDDARAWEQAQMARLFLHHVKRPRTFLIGLDTVWCSASADTERITKRGFPDWMFDNNAWNDWFYMLNAKALEIAGRQVAYRLGFSEARIPANGFQVFTPPEDAYDAGKAKQNIWQGRKPYVVASNAPPRVASEVERLKWSFPALAWLSELIATIPPGTRIVLAFMPVHSASFLSPGSPNNPHETECKSRVAAIARARGAHVVDFRIPSSITTEDTNYWDPLHYRRHIGQRIVREIRNAVDTGRGDPGGDWAYLSAP